MDLCPFFRQPLRYKLDVIQLISEMAAKKARPRTSITMDQNFISNIQLPNIGCQVLNMMS